MTKEMNDALLRSMLVAVTPSSIDELLMVADALRLWQKNPGLRSEVVDKRRVDARPMLERCMLVLAMVELNEPPAGNDMADYRAPAADDEEH